MVQIALKLIAVISVVLVVLISLGFFVMSQSSSSGASASYDRIFFGRCEEIQQKGCGEGSGWDLVKGDTQFLDACLHLFGKQDAYSCTYQFCSGCKKYDTSEDAVCGAWCDGISTKSLNRNTITSACTSKPKCAPQCSACSE